MTPLEIATQYRRRGWLPIPAPHREKNPGIDGWQRMRLSEPDLPFHFNGHPMNVGILMGEPSGWIVDVDLDHQRAVELADRFLPPTPAVFGRKSKPRSHRIFRVSKPTKSKRIESKKYGSIVELRSTGGQTIFPGSTHVSGEAIEWEVDGAEPAIIDPDILLANITALGNAVKAELKESDPAKTTRKPHNTGTPLTRIELCVAAMLRMNMADHGDGSSRLLAAACRVVEHNLSNIDGILAIRQYATTKPFPREWTDEQVLARIVDAEKRVERKPVVVIDTEEHRAIGETIAALSRDPELFQRGGLCRIRRQQDEQNGIIRSGTISIEMAPTSWLRERCTKFARFVTQTRVRGETVENPVHPPQWLVAGIESRGDWPGIRPLVGISDVPIIRPDGTLWQTAGYDAATGVLYEPNAQFPVIPDDVTLEDAMAAMESLYTVICDFRFDGEEHKAAYIAGLITPAARYAYTGPSPLFLVDANIRGAGKSLLVQIIGQIHTGAEMPVSSYSHDSEEMRKKITAIAIAGDRLVHLDNLQGMFGNDALDRALTSTRWKDRILGKSENVERPLIPIWFSTGNNVMVAADTTRRIIHIRLDVLEEKPEERSGFRHPDLLAWIRDNRPQLLVDVLTILVAYIRAGKPSQGLTPFGSFEGWSGLVREAVVWAGLPDPCKTRARLAESSDATTDALSQLLAAWVQYDSTDQGIVVSSTLAEIYRQGYIPTDPAIIEFRSALENLVGCPPGKVPSARQVGNRLRHYRRRVHAKMYIDTDPKEDKRGGAVWRVKNAGEGVA